MTNRLTALANMLRPDSGATRGERDNAKSLLIKLTPKDIVKSGMSPEKRKAAEIVFSRLESLRWEIEEKHWRSSINVQKDLVDSLPNIPAEWIREITDGLQTGEYPAFSKLIIRGS